MLVKAMQQTYDSTGVCFDDKSMTFLDGGAMDGVWTKRKPY
jgi:hypothetical protein